MFVGPITKVDGAPDSGYGEYLLILKVENESNDIIYSSYKELSSHEEDIYENGQGEFFDYHIAKTIPSGMTGKITIFLFELDDDIFYFVPSKEIKPYAFNWSKKIKKQHMIA
jgi:hypothetical protein